MVIAGVYLGLIINDNLIILLDKSCLFLLLLIILLLITLIPSLFKAITANDIKGIIAFPTINQISYMFLALIINPIISLFHIIIHALFKS